ncbi:MAG: hypothetical protein RI556_07630 [Hydrogenovibrio sp.]|uniref:hypothetical protein n=1 Tax=Hydrogenovibrio sp. TaxID=2065821 RepID=UPI00286FD43A|nr:hypothetical protein [Hydrogenovibrio sp.]MDR9499030.1 hypothetical protein [Hydrogenovibrio sp.]
MAQSKTPETTEQKTGQTSHTQKQAVTAQPVNADTTPKTTERKAPVKSQSANRSTQKRTPKKSVSESTDKGTDTPVMTTHPRVWPD